MSVLVTGGAGYIGSHAVKVLRAAGEEVVIYDNLCAGHKAAAAAAGAPLEVGDIQDVARLRQVMAAHGVNAVMHFAAWLSVGESVKDPIGYYENNVGGARAVLPALVGSKVPHFIFS
jgi:UDP-glucose 4-epimerase